MTFSETDAVRVRDAARETIARYHLPGFAVGIVRGADPDSSNGCRAPAPMVASITTMRSQHDRRTRRDVPVVVIEEQQTASPKSIVLSRRAGSSVRPPSACRWPPEPVEEAAQVGELVRRL
jgi:hypothetical protein